MIREDFQQGMESALKFKMNTATKTNWLVYAAATVIMTLSCAVLFSVTASHC